MHRVIVSARSLLTALLSAPNALRASANHWRIAPAAEETRVKGYAANEARIYPPGRTVAVQLEENRTVHGSTIPLVSVVIPSYQAARHIRSTLQALVTQKTDLPHEIIVVDSSTDETPWIVEREFPQIRLLRRPERCHVGAARNLGVEAARGGVILFIDTDAIPCPTWLDQMARSIRDDNADAVGGAMSNGTPWSVTGSAGFYLEFFRFVGSGRRHRAARHLVGGNSGFRREILSRTPYADHSVGEDMLFSARLARQGKKLVFLERASVLHMNRTGFRIVLSYQRKLGSGTYFYRSHDSPEQLHSFRAIPPLVFLLPFVVMLWIGLSLLHRRTIIDFLRFVLILPVCFVANMSWARGFYDALQEANRSHL